MILSLTGMYGKAIRRLLLLAAFCAMAAGMAGCSRNPDGSYSLHLEPASGSRQDSKAADGEGQ